MKNMNSYFSDNHFNTTFLVMLMRKQHSYICYSIVAISFEKILIFKPCIKLKPLPVYHIPCVNAIITASQYKINWLHIHSCESNFI